VTSLGVKKENQSSLGGKMEFDKNSNWERIGNLKEKFNLLFFLVGIISNINEE
jgi:hypothetical protein